MKIKNEPIDPIRGVAVCVLDRATTRRTFRSETDPSDARSVARAVGRSRSVLSECPFI